MTASKANIKQAIDELLSQPSPKSGNRIVDELRPHERSLRQLIERGWTPTKIATHLKSFGIDGSKDAIKIAVTKVVGDIITPKKKAPKQATAEGKAEA